MEQITACRRGDLDTLKSYTKLDRFLPDIAAESGQFYVIKYLHSVGLDIRPALTRAYKHLDIVKYIIENNTVPFKLVHMSAVNAAEEGCIEVLEYIMSKYPEEKFELNYLALWAIRANKFDTVKYLIETCKFDPKTDPYIISNAAGIDNPEMLLYLIRKGCNPTVDNDNPICTAMNNGCIANVKILREMGCDPRVMDDFGVKLACVKGHVEMVDYLINECGANIHAENDWALKHTKCEEILNKYYK